MNKTGSVEGGGERRGGGQILHFDNQLVCTLCAVVASIDSARW